MNKIVGFFSFIAWVGFTSISQACYLPDGCESEQDLESQYSQYIRTLDPTKTTQAYPQQFKDLSSGIAEKQTAALKTLSETGAPEAIPFIALFLDSKTNTEVRNEAALSIEKIVSKAASCRSDAGTLRPVRYLAYKMFRTVEPQMQIHGITIVKVLKAREFERELRYLSSYSQPEVAAKAKLAIKELGLAETSPEKFVSSLN